MAHHSARNLKWRGVRAAGRITAALFGGGLFAWLAWQPNPPPKDHEGSDGRRDAAKHRGRSSSADSTATDDLKPTWLEASGDQGFPSNAARVGALTKPALRDTPRGRRLLDRARSDEHPAFHLGGTVKGHVRATSIANPRGPP